MQPLSPTAAVMMAQTKKTRIGLGSAFGGENIEFLERGCDTWDTARMKKGVGGGVGGAPALKTISSPGGAFFLIIADEYEADQEEAPARGSIGASGHQGEMACTMNLRCSRSISLISPVATSRSSSSVCLREMRSRSTSLSSPNAEMVHPQSRIVD